MNTFGGIYRISCLSAAALLAVGSALAANQAGSAKFTVVQGSVSLDSAAAHVGDVAGSGQVISTGEVSMAKLDLKLNGPDLIVTANSRVSIDELQYNADGSETVSTTKLGLKNGKVQAYVKKSSAESKFVITTPTTTAAIRGTVVEVTVTGLVIVWDGVVDVTWTNPSTGQSQNFVVSAGQEFDPTTGAVGPVPPDLTAPPLGPFFVLPGNEATLIFGNEAFPGGWPGVQPIGPVVIISPVLGGNKP